MEVRELVFEFGRQGLRELTRRVNVPLTYEKVYSWVVTKLSEFGDLYENALDIQAKFITEDILERLKEGKVLSSYRVLVFAEATPVLRSLARRAGVSLRRVERYWNEAKKQYMKMRNKKEKDLTSDDYRYIVGIVKRRLKLS